MSHILDSFSTLDLVTELLATFETSKVLEQNHQPTLCICGEPFIKINDPTALYNGAGAACDICSIIGTTSDIFLHCDRDKFDICSVCSKAYRPQCWKTAGSKCQYLQRFVLLMQQYNKGYYSNETNILDAINDYLHLLHQHHTDEQFEYITGRLGVCNIVQCKIFSRKIRDIQKASNADINHILDKMHCYFCHSSDIGNRMTPKDRKFVYCNDNNEQISNSNDSGNNIMKHLINKKIIKLRQVLTQRRIAYKNVLNGLDDRIDRRYNQLFQNNDESKSTDIDMNAEMNEHNMYSFGYEFKYDYDEEIAVDAILIKEQYHSLKEELTTNNICVLTVEQFNHEYQKALIHFNSAHCKNTYRPFENDYFQKHIEIQHLLSLMVYCNYTNFQYLFSKTYRENKGFRHKNFYWMGRNLKMCVHLFGTNQKSTFYHGIGKKLLFPKFLGYNASNFLGHPSIDIYCPLSTSSSLAVATNFTNDNNGIIVHFENRTGGKYFSLSWLSDFPGEHEYLFIQGTGSLLIGNIIDVCNGFEYNLMLSALHKLHMITCGLCPNMKYSVSVLIEAIIANQISKVVSCYQSFKSLTEYAEKMIISCLQKKKQIEIDYVKCKQLYPFILELLFHSNCEWIDINLIKILYPNTEKILIHNIDICPETFEYILKYLNQNKENKQLREITICPNQKTKSSVKWAIDQYSSILKKINMIITGIIYENVLTIAPEIDHVQFVCGLINYMGSIYFLDENNEIKMCMDKLIKTELNQQHAENIQNNKEQQVFHQYCLNKTTLTIDFNAIVDLHLIGLFFNSESNWINIRMITKLFPNLNSLAVAGISLCSFMIDDIIKYWSNNTSKLKRINILRLTKNSELSVSLAISKYKDDFKYLHDNVEMRANDHSLFLQKF
eukprot:523565_1